jgi:hypothetical protein
MRLLRFNEGKSIITVLNQSVLAILPIFQFPNTISDRAVQDKIIMNFCAIMHLTSTSTFTDVMVQD